MEKPLFLIPFIWVYKLCFFIFKLPIKIIRYFSLGLFFSIWFLAKFLLSLFIFIFYNIFISLCVFTYHIIKYFIVGIIFTSFIIYKFFKYLLLGFVFPFVIVYNLIFDIIGKIVKFFTILSDKNKSKKEAKRRKKEALLLEKQRKRENILLEKKRIMAEKQKVKEKEAIRKKEEIEAKRKRQQKDIFVNENIKLEKKSFANKLNDLFTFIGNIPKKIVTAFKNRYEKLSFVKNYRNKKDINREVLLIDFEGDDASKSEIKIVYEYVAKNPEGKVVKGYFEAYSKVEVHSFLLSEGFEVYSIKTSRWIQMTRSNVGQSGGKVKNSDLIFFLTQLSTYIKAGITLVESLKILTRQFKNKKYQHLFRAIIYDLSMGDNFSDALFKQGNAFPKLLINMVKAAEMTGELPEALDDMAEYFTETEKTRKQMVTAMMYPAIIFTIAIGVMVFIMLFVIPRFVGIYQNMNNVKIPAFTLGVMAFSAFLKTQIAWILLGIIIFIFVFIYLYKNIKVFRTTIQWFMMHMPVIGNVIIYNEVTMFTKTFSSLLKHNVFITESMEVLNKITNNEIYKMLILDTITNLAKGEKISLAFKDQWAFPIPAYEMIVTGEKTGQLAEMMAKVSDYYQELHKNAVARIKTFVEPILIILLTIGVGIIVLAIVIPMFDVYKNIASQ